MKLKYFRITNYKSIIDSGICELASDITILVGKNESGKTAILEALRDFDKDVYELPPSAIPLDGSEDLPRIELCFQPDQTEVEAILSAADMPGDANLSSYLLTNGLRIAKDGMGQYQLNDEFLSQHFKESGSQHKEEQRGQLKSAKERLAVLLEGRTLPDLNLDSSPEEIQKKSRELTIMVKSFLPTLHNEQKQEEVVNSLRQIIRETRGYTEADVSLKVKFLNAIVERLPRFIYFSELIINFPFAIPIEKIKETESMVDFAKISGLDLDRVINATDIQKRINILNRHTALVNGEFGDFWKQDQIELVLKPEGGSILFGIKERNRTDIFKVEQRSKGFQWFLSFYLRLVAQRSKDNIILIDEPGTNLHAKAQKEILKVLQDKIATETPVILSTHSPYFIDSWRLDRIRLVQKNSERGSIVSNHIEKDADSDTLLPINTSLKMNAAGTFPLSGKRNIIIQDLADYYFLDGMKRFCNLSGPKEVELLPCPGDQGSLDQLISLLKGFDYDFRILLGRGLNDQAQGDKLKWKFALKEENLASISLDPGLTIEDLIEPTDFYSCVIGSEIPEDRSLPNSQYFEIHNIDRLLAAQNFHENAKAGDLNLSEETRQAFQKVFDRILREPAAPSVPAPVEKKKTEPLPEVKRPTATETFVEIKELPKEEPRRETSAEPEPVRQIEELAAEPSGAPAQQKTAATETIPTPSPPTPTPAPPKKVFIPFFKSARLYRRAE